MQKYLHVDKDTGADRAYWDTSDTSLFLCWSEILIATDSWFVLFQKVKGLSSLLRGMIVFAKTMEQ